MSDRAVEITGSIATQPLSVCVSRRAPRVSESLCRVRVGPVVIEIRSEWAEAVQDFLRLYRGHEVFEMGDEGEAGEADKCSGLSLIRMVVRRTGGSRWRGGRYAISGDGEELFTDLSADEVLPYLEWGVNYRFIATQRNYLQLHSAAMAYANQGVLLVGRSGSGKSTLTAALAARGWSYYSDEFGLIGARDLRLHPFPKAICVKAGSFALVEKMGLPLHRRRPYVKAFKGKVGYVSPDQVSVARDPVRIRLIVFPSYTGAERTTYRSISSSQAVFSLAADAFNRAAFGDRLLAILGTVAEGAQCLAVELGDLQEAVDLLEYRMSDASPPNQGA